MPIDNRIYRFAHRGKDPQDFVRERERLMRVDRGTGSSGGDRRSKKRLTPEQRGAISRAASAPAEEGGEGEVELERVVRMPEVPFLQNRFGWEPK